MIGVHKEQRPRTEAGTGTSQGVGEMATDGATARKDHAFAEKGFLAFSQVSSYKIIAVDSYWRVSIKL